MEREEAITRLHWLKRELIKGTDINEPIDMAIEALQGDTVATIQTGQTYGKSAYIKELAEVVRCKDCKFKSLYDDGDTKYYYCALEDRPNRNWSVDDTDYCSWGERKGGDPE